jgi:hypothetical protein
VNRHARAVLAVGSRRTPAFEPPEVARLREQVAELEAESAQRLRLGLQWRARADAAEAVVERVRDVVDWLSRALATSARDWGQSLDTALIYGVVCGWGPKEGDTEEDGNAEREIVAQYADRASWIEGMLRCRQVIRALDDATPPTPDAAAPDANDAAGLIGTLGRRIVVTVTGTVDPGRMDGTQVYISATRTVIDGDLWLDRPHVTVTEAPDA